MMDGCVAAHGRRVRVHRPRASLLREEAALVARYADMVADHIRARIPPTIPSGWCSRYQFSTDVTEGDVRRNLRETREVRLDFIPEGA
jgi:hypothetical protein